MKAHKPPRSTTSVGIVGCGTIGSAVAQALERRYARRAWIVALHDRVRERALALHKRLHTHPPVVSLPELLRCSQLVIEAASVSVAARVARLALAANRDVLVMSAGGLLADRTWLRAAQRSRGRLYVPSGGLCGLDGLKAMAVGSLQRIQLTTRKPPQALASAPWVRSRRLSLNRLRRPRVLFEGSPAEAIKAFPQNTNVAATVVLACLLNGQRPQAARSVHTTVRVVADPSISSNIHEIDVQGDCGRLSARVESRPSRANPRTSELAVRSAIATVCEIFDPVRIGT